MGLALRNTHGSANGGDIRFRTSADLAGNLRFFREKLQPKQWQEDPSETHEQEGFGQLVFRKEKAWIKVSLTDPSDGEGLHGMIEGTGLVAENDPRRSQSEALPATPAPSAGNAGKQLDTIGEQIIREATQSGVSPKQLEQILKQLDSQLPSPDAEED